MSSPLTISRISVGDTPVNLGVVAANSLIMNLDSANSVYVSPNTDVSPSTGAPIVAGASLTWAQTATCYIVADAGTTVSILVSNAIATPRVPPAVVPPSLNDITFSINEPSGTATENALWFQINNTTDANVIGEWFYDSTNGWTPYPLTNSVIANLDAGKINTGTLTGINIEGAEFIGGSISDTTTIPPSPPAVTYSTSAPSGTGSAVNAIWYQIDGSNNVIGMWNWNGSQWVARQLASAALAYVDAGKITTGTLQAISIVSVSISSSNITGGNIDGAYITASSGSNSVALYDDVYSGLPGIAFSTAYGSTYIYASGSEMVLQGTVSVTGGLSATNLTTTGDVTATAGTLSGEGLSINGSGLIEGNLTVESSITAYGNLNVSTIQSTTGSANVIWSSSSTRFYHTSSHSADKLDQQPIGVEYDVLKLSPVSWIDKTFHDEDEKYSDRTAGFILESVWDQVKGTALEALVTKRRDNGEIESIDYDRLSAYLIPVVADIVSRVARLEQLHEHH